MNRTSLGRESDELSSSGFASPAPPFSRPPLPSSSTSGKPAAGLSKPHLLKARKHLASPRVRLSVIDEADDGSGLKKPFLPGLGNVSAVPAHGPGAPGLDEKLGRWKPFSSETGTIHPANVNFCWPTSGCGVFIFGSGSKKGINSGSSSGDDAMKSNGVDYWWSPSMKTAVSSFSYGSDRIGCSSADAFTFGGGTSGPISEWNSMENTSGQIPEASEPTKSSRSSLVLGPSSFTDISKESNESINKQNHVPDGFILRGAANRSSNLPKVSSDPGLESLDSGELESAAFVFGLNDFSKLDEKKVGSARTMGGTASFFSVKNGIFATDVPGHVSDLSHSNAEGPINLRNPQSTSFGSSTSHSASFSLGARNLEFRDQDSSNVRGSFINVNTGNSEKGAFLFGSGAEMNSNLENSSAVFDEGSFSRLPDELRKLNLHGSSNEYASVNAKKSDERSKLNDVNKVDFVHNINPSSSTGDLGSVKSESAGFCTANSVGSGRENMGTKDMKDAFLRESTLDFDANTFVFKPGVRVDSSSTQRSSAASDESVLEKLPDQLCKLKLQNSANSVSEDMRQSNQSSNVNEYYTFSSNIIENAPGSFTYTLVDELPAIIKNMNIGTDQAPQNMKSQNVDHPAAFIFGKNMNKESTSEEILNTSSTNFSEGSSSKFSDDMQRHKSEGSKNVSNYRGQKDTEFTFKVGMKTGPHEFTFGTNVRVSSFMAASTFNTLSNDMKKLKIQSEKGNTSGNSQTDAHLGMQDPSAFQSGPEGENFNMDAFLASDTDGSSVPTQEHMSSFVPPLFPRHSGSYGTDFTFINTNVTSEEPLSEFIALDPFTYGVRRDKLVTGQNQAEPSSTKGDNKTTRMKKKRGKLKQHFPLCQNFNPPFCSVNKVGEKEPESPGGCSPMDYSPYHDNLVADQSSREASIASDEAFCTFSRSMSTDNQISARMEENLVNSIRHLDIGEDANGHGKLYANNYKHHAESEVGSRSSGDEKTFLPIMENSISESNNTKINGDSNTTAMEAEDSSFNSNMERQVNSGTTFFTFGSSSDDFIGSNFTFSASTFSQVSQPAMKHQCRSNYRMKGGHDSDNAIMNADVPLVFCSISYAPAANTPVQPDPTQDPASMLSGPQSGEYRKAEVNTIPVTGKLSITRNAETIAEYEACEKWRLRGNQAYSNGDLPKAEEYYTHGIKCISQSETFGSSNRALMLCYSNRAATRMSLGRMRKALRDCTMATAIDPYFLRAQVRAANCYLFLGEIEEAAKLFKKCLESDNARVLDQKTLVEASEGLRKTQQVSEYIVQSEEQLLKRTSNAAVTALRSICEALLISPHSERLMQRKADALLMLQRYDEVIQFCEQTREQSERNHDSDGTDAQFGDKLRNSPTRTWHWHIIGKAYFYLGKLEQALEFLKKHEQVNVKMHDDGSLVSSASLFTTINELLCLKVAGNEAFQTGRHSQAVEHYTAALACNTESHPFAAICLCNRAAAFQALGQITDAIADCTLAIALDSTYAKALSRRATLDEMIRDYGRAANDLHRLVSLFERQSADKGIHSGSLGKSMNNNADVHRARQRLSSIEDEAIKDTPLDMYMILGVEPSSSAADVKKAYRKAALRHHPDKAGQLIARSELLDDSHWGQVVDEVQKDADRLFKMIGEAYTILSDPKKRLQYDEEEEMRKPLKKGHIKSNYHRGPQDSFSRNYERNLNRYHWQTNESSNWRSEYTPWYK